MAPSELLLRLRVEPGACRRLELLKLAQITSFEKPGGVRRHQADDGVRICQCQRRAGSVDRLLAAMTIVVRCHGEASAWGDVAEHARQIRCADEVDLNEARGAVFPQQP